MAYLMMMEFAVYLTAVVQLPVAVSRQSTVVSVTRLTPGFTPAAPVLRIAPIRAELALVTVASAARLPTAPSTARLIAIILVPVLAPVTLVIPAIRQVRHARSRSHRVPPLVIMEV
jgi:hypothetical protein